MSNNIMINEKKKALLAYKEKILDEIKYYEKSIDEFRTSHKHNSFYDEQTDSSDGEDDFLSAIDMGPSITQLKLQQNMLKTCLHATQELTSLMVLQSEVDVLVEEPKFEGELPVTEAGTWREVTVECRIDLVPFTMTFYMHTPDRKFAPPSYRGLRVVPVKSAHELELSKSVLHSLKVPSDAVEVLRSYAAGYRSRRTTLARLANKYTSALFMEPHAEGGFVLKCADLLEVSWRLENKWSPVAPFHHRMKFDLEFMEESYIKIITQAHKQLLDPAIQTDERTLLLAKIITTCLEARGPIDPESDLESKTTERDNDMEKRDSETEKRDSEVMAPPKSLPKKGRQKNKDSVPNTAQKRSMDDENCDSGGKKMKNDVPEPKKSITENTNTRKSKISDVVTEGGKKRKLNEANKVVNSKNVKETGSTEDDIVKPKDVNKEGKASNLKPKNVRESESNVVANKTKNVKEVEDKTANTNSKTRKNRDDVASEEKTSNPKTNSKVTKESDVATKKTNANTKNLILKEPANIDNKPKQKTKVIKETGNNKEKLDSEKHTENKNKDNVIKNNNKMVKEPNNTEKVSNKAKNIAKEAGNTEDDNKTKNNVKTKGDGDKNKARNITTKEAGNTGDDNKNDNNVKSKSNDKKKLKNVANMKSKENIDANKDAAHPKNKITDKNTNVGKSIEANVKMINKTKNTEAEKVKNVANTKNDDPKIKNAPTSTTNAASANNNDQTKKASVKVMKNKETIPQVATTGTEKIVKEKTVNPKVKHDVQTVKKVTEKNATNIKNKDKISQISSKVTEKNVKEIPTLTKNVPEKVLSGNIITKKTKENTKIIIKKPITHKIASHRNSLKPQNPPKILKAGYTKTVSAGNTEKENGGKGSKIPQKALSTISEGSSKKNILRISPRIIPSKFKTQSQEVFKHKMVKTTNIPRLLKKPAPKMT